MRSLAEVLGIHKYSDPTPEDLGLPSDQQELWAIERAGYSRYGASLQRYWADHGAAAADAKKQTLARMRNRTGAHRCDAVLK